MPTHFTMIWQQMCMNHLICRDKMYIFVHAVVISGSILMIRYNLDIGFVNWVKILEFCAGLQIWFKFVSEIACFGNMVMQWES